MSRRRQILAHQPGGFSRRRRAAAPAQIPGLTLRRAFRYSDTKRDGFVKASPVEPDVRVETQDTLSLGEDRTVLADNCQRRTSPARAFSG